MAQLLSPERGLVGGRGLAEFVLSRLGTGVGPGEAAAFNHIGYATWLEQQLNPPKGDDPATAGRLANAALRIKYGAGDLTKQQQWAAVDEMRPLKALGQPSISFGRYSTITISPDRNGDAFSTK
jgi:hypothetical protein